MRKVIVNDKFNNKKIQAFLQFNFKGLSSSMFFKTLRKKDIKVNGKRISDNIVIYQNDVIEIYLEDKFLFNTSELDIIYEDDNIIIVNKRAGIEIVSETERDLLSVLKQTYPTVRAVHRLDRNTEGLTIFALNDMAEKIKLLKEKNR